MKKLIYFSFLCLSIFTFGQNLNAIKSEVSKINNTKNFKIKVLDNDYFVDVRNEVTDNGQELKVFYKNSELKKLVHEVGLSAWKIVTEYCFQDKKLIFVYQKKYQTVGENGFLDKPKLIFEGRYYFESLKIIKKIEKGESTEKFDFIKKSESFKKSAENFCTYCD